MSQYDDELAEQEARLDAAWQKCFYGKRYSPAYELAMKIKAIRYILKEKEEGKADPELNPGEQRYLLSTAGWLLLAAITSSQKLVEVAKALEAERSEDPRQINILRAYEDCIEGRYPPTVVEVGKCYTKCEVPTLAQLRDAFIKRFGEQCWSSDFATRKTLRILGLPLSEAQRGRPPGRRSIIRNSKR